MTYFPEKVSGHTTKGNATMNKVAKPVNTKTVGNTKISSSRKPDISSYIRS